MSAAQMDRLLAALKTRAGHRGRCGGSPDVDAASKRKLRDQRAELNPFELRRRLEEGLRDILQIAVSASSLQQAAHINAGLTCGHRRAPLRGFAFGGVRSRKLSPRRREGEEARYRAGKPHEASSQLKKHRLGALKRLGVKCLRHVLAIGPIPPRKGHPCGAPKRGQQVHLRQNRRLVFCSRRRMPGPADKERHANSSLLEASFVPPQSPGGPVP